MSGGGIPDNSGVYLVLVYRLAMTATSKKASGITPKTVEFCRMHFFVEIFIEIFVVVKYGSKELNCQIIGVLCAITW